MGALAGWTPETELICTVLYYNSLVDFYNNTIDTSDVFSLEIYLLQYGVKLQKNNWTNEGCSRKQSHNLTIELTGVGVFSY